MGINVLLSAEWFIFLHYKAFLNEKKEIVKEKMVIILKKSCIFAV